MNDQSEEPVTLELNEVFAKLFHIQEEPGWCGVFSRKQWHGAIPNGKRIMKTHSQSGDTHPDGTLGTVLGSIQPLPWAPYCYFVEWDCEPKVARLVIQHRIKEA